jgi:hypothetical protein
MKHAFLLLLLGTCAARGGDNPVPAPMPKERYGELGAHSPFAPATASPAVQTQASFAANWFVSGMARVNDEDFVSIKARDLSTQFSLFGREVNPQNGVALASVNWSDVVGRSTVILRKGTETARLEFNEADLRNPPQIATAPRTGDVVAKAAAAGSLAGNPLPARAPEVRRRSLPIPGPR